MYISYMKGPSLLSDFHDIMIYEYNARVTGGVRVAGNAEVYIVLALLIGVVTVVVGCWLSDNCWSPEPEDVLAGG